MKKIYHLKNFHLEFLLFALTKKTNANNSLYGQARLRYIILLWIENVEHRSCITLWIGRNERLLCQLKRFVDSLWAHKNLLQWLYNTSVKFDKKIVARTFSYESTITKLLRLITCFPRKSSSPKAFPPFLLLWKHVFFFGPNNEAEMEKSINFSCWNSVSVPTT